VREGRRRDDRRREGRRRDHTAPGSVGHTGELPGYNTSVFYDTTSDTTIIVQVNSDIASGDCPDDPTLVDDPGEAVCSSPATRMFVALSTALGHPFPAP
jgi:D-alanyl-D-alanine carboxypeptidase